MLVPIGSSLFNLVWKMPDRVIKNKSLEKRYREIEAAIETEDRNDLNRLHGWQRTIKGLYPDASGLYNALNAECYNAATTAVQNPPKKLLKLNFHHRLLKNWAHFRPETFRLEAAS